MQAKKRTKLGETSNLDTEPVMSDLLRTPTGPVNQIGNPFGYCSDGITKGTIAVSVNARIGDIVERYLKRRGQEIGSLVTALERGEFEQIQKVAHDLVGTGGSFGFEGMSLIGRSLRDAAKQRHTAEIKILIEGLAEYISRVEVVYE